ncbi:MAG TPA: hypothetical protein VM165_05735 [Planctomycetaceae bacterium]|nr:hypothetical protein [Planctomycetaceae bacterium]
MTTLAFPVRGAHGSVLASMELLLFEVFEIQPSTTSAAQTAVAVLIRAGGLVMATGNGVDDRCREPGGRRQLIIELLPPRRWVVAV